MTAHRRTLEVFNYYRDAELRGVELLLRLVALLPDDPEAQMHLTRHIVEETQHAWLWTKHIVERNGRPTTVRRGYQARMGLRILPRSLLDLLALSIVVEERSLLRYREHAARPGIDDATQRVLRRVAADEEWHLTWMRAKLVDLVKDDAGAAAHVEAVSERYRRVDEEVYLELAAYEREVASGQD